MKINIHTKHSIHECFVKIFFFLRCLEFPSNCYQAFFIFKYKSDNVCFAAAHYNEKLRLLSLLELGNGKLIAATFISVQITEAVKILYYSYWV